MITDEEFRKTPSLRDELRTALNGNAMIEALALVKCRNELVSLPLGVTGIDAARAHEERRVRAVVVAELFELIKPWPEAPEDRPKEDFGTGHSVDEFEQPQTVS